MNKIRQADKDVAEHAIKTYSDVWAHGFWTGVILSFATVATVTFIACNI